MEKVAAFLLLTGVVSASPEAFLFQEKHMGCLFSLKLVGKDHESLEPAAKAAFATIHGLEQKLSDYDPKSEISQWELQLTPQAAQQPSPEVWECLVAAQAFWKASQGAFDITLGHPNQLWRDMRKSQQLPSPKQITAAREKSGFHHLKLTLEPNTLSTDLAGLKFDFGGIAKGQALDHAGRVLREKHGVAHYLLDAGGQLAAWGHAPGKNGWTVAVESLPEETEVTIVRLQNQQLATSGDLHQFVELQGKRYSHITDPQTGLGTTTRRQASVICPQGMTADALATVCCLQAPSEALKTVAKFPQAACRILEVQDGKTVEHYSQNWPTQNKP
jgi:FAD:protein FMN transferase